jgi:hypothetical protein
MANIFAGNSNNVKYVSQNHVNNQLISSTDIFVFYQLESFSNNIASLINQLHSEDKGALIVLSPDSDKFVAKYVKDKFDIELSTGISKNLYPDWSNQYSDLFNSVSKEQFTEMRFNDLIKARFSKKSNILLAKGNQPIIAMKEDTFLFFFNDNNDFVTNTTYPVFMNKIFEKLSNSNLEISTNYLGNSIELAREAEVNDKAIISGNYTFNDLGIYKIRNKADKTAYQSVNLDEKQLAESLKNSAVFSNSYQNITEKWESHLFAESGRFELLKYLLIAILILFVAELVIVKFSK